MIEINLKLEEQELRSKIANARNEEKASQLRLDAAVREDEMSKMRKRILELELAEKEARLQIALMEKANR